MINFLIKTFIKSDNLQKTNNRNKLISLTGYLGLFFNILLFLIKITIGLLINSISVISDAVNNLTDSFASIITIVGTYLSEKPADKTHPFGHGRGEYLASLSVGISITIVGITLLKNSIENTFNPSNVELNIPALIILAISICVKIYMYVYNTKVANMIDSSLNRSQAVDSRNDVIMSTVVIISVILASKFGILIEGPVGIFVSLVIIKSGIEILREMSELLLGKEVDKETLDRLEEIIKSGEFVNGVHDIEIHDYGKNKLFGTAHVEVPVNIDVYSMHEVVDSIERKVKEELYIDLSIHMDPSYCLDKDHFYPAPCNMKNKEKQKALLDKNLEIKHKG